MYFVCCDVINCNDIKSLSNALSKEVDISTGIWSIRLNGVSVYKLNFIGNFDNKRKWEIECDCNDDSIVLNITKKISEILCSNAIDHHITVYDNISGKDVAKYELHRNICK